MIRILNARQIRNLDRYTIEHEPIHSINLMERACEAFVSWFTLKFDTSHSVAIFCGPGNNGGDGLGIARLLIERDYYVTVWSVGKGKKSGDFQINLDRLTGVKELIRIRDIPSKGPDIVIDALFGSGISRPVKGIYARLIQKINSWNCIRVSVDIPSGLMADGPSDGDIVRADYTITFQLPKLAFLLASCAPWVGEWHAVNIGLDQGFILRQDTQYYLTQEPDIRAIYRKRKKFDHKGTFGKALIIAGSYGKMGAAVLAARGAMRSGLGLLTVHIPQKGYNILQTAVPEAMVRTDTHEEIFTGTSGIELFDVLGIGPGIGTDMKSVKAFARLMEEFRKPMVIDADAINMLALDRDLIRLLPPGSILTPHPGELKRLVGEWGNEFERLEKQSAFAVATGTFLVAKGAFTAIATPQGKIYFNSTGNPGMATAGSGDVLTGVLTGVLAQGYIPVEAAVLGVYLHGLAGDIATYYTGYEALTATDIVHALPEAYQKISQKQG